MPRTRRSHEQLHVTVPLLPSAHQLSPRSALGHAVILRCVAVQHRFSCMKKAVFLFSWQGSGFVSQAQEWFLGGGGDGCRVSIC